MSEEKQYQFNNYVIGYDKGLGDRSCLTISKFLNDNLYVMAELYDGSAEVVSTMLDNLSSQLQQKENIIKEVREYIEPIVELDNDIMLKGKILKPVLEILDKEVN